MVMSYRQDRMMSFYLMRAENITNCGQHRHNTIQHNNAACTDFLSVQAALLLRLVHRLIFCYGFEIRFGIAVKDKVSIL